MGWGSTGLNTHFGGLIQSEYYLTGKSWEKSIVSPYVPCYQGESFGPGISQCHFNILVLPSEF